MRWGGYEREDLIVGAIWLCGFCALVVIALVRLLWPS